MLTISVIAIAGVFAGSLLGRAVNGIKLKKAFGWFILAMGIYIIMKQIRERLP